MTNPSPQVVQLKIAELQGWTELKLFTDYKDDALEYPELLGGINPENGRREVVPDWPDDRNASYELPVKSQMRYGMAMLAIKGEDPRWIKRHTAYNESLAWILYKGYRWDDKALEFKPVK